MEWKKDIKLLELFAGSRSIGKVADDLEYSVFSSDIESFNKIDYVIDILKFDIKKIPFVPDIIWASPPCEGFSVASICYHWKKENNIFIPQTKKTLNNIKLVKKTLEIIKYYKILNPFLIWYIENPRGILRKLSFMQNLPIRKTITYCQYGEKRMKPTDIWTNNLKWYPQKICKRGDPCHDPAPRGSWKTGTLKLKKVDRSKIPPKLCREILLSI